MRKFQPRVTEVAANIQTGVVVANNLVRFRAQVSQTRDPNKTKLALEAAFGGQVCVTAKSIVEVEPALGGYGTIVEGFGVMRPATYNYGSDDWQAAFASDTGNNLRCIASNMYMDEEERCWSVRIEGGQAVITRDGVDDVAELLASASRVNVRERHSLQPLISSADVGGVVFVDQDGELREAFVFASVNGDDELVEVFSTEETASDEAPVPFPINRLQVLAFEAVEPMDFGDKDAKDVYSYYFRLYSYNPAVMQKLRELVGGNV